MNDTAQMQRRSAPCAGTLARSFVLVAALAVSACEGSNLFGDDPVSASRPEITGLNAPTTLTLGSEATIQVLAVARRGLRDVRLEYTGAITSTETVAISDSPTDTVTVTRTVLLPGTTVDSLLIIRVTATDVAGRISQPALDTIIGTRVLSPALMAGSRR